MAPERTHTTHALSKPVRTGPVRTGPVRTGPVRTGPVRTGGRSDEQAHIPSGTNKPGTNALRVSAKPDRTRNLATSPAGVKGALTGLAGLAVEGAGKPQRARTAKPLVRTNGVPKKARQTTGVGKSGDSNGGKKGVKGVSTAACHERVRSAHATETAEDYTEAIADMIAINGEARVVDVARKLGVSHVTVTRTVARLQRDGWLTAQPYRSIFLTEAGAKLAVRAKRRHDAVVRFLIALGVDAITAHADAEGIEHHVSPKTLAALERFASHAQ